ncbi:MAG: sensor histidine kinase [Candidatus Gastranaerophilaceae bacterium]
MLETVTLVIHYITITLFGIFVSAAFLGIRMSRKNIAVLLGFSCAVGAASTFVLVFFGETLSTQLYPLTVHLPLIIFLTLVFKKPFVSTCLSVFTAYMCCQISRWIGLVALEISDKMWIYYTVRIAVTIIVFVILVHFFANAESQLINKPVKSILILAIMPTTYYLYDYATGVYTSLMYSGNATTSEFLAFMLSIVYLLFILIYFNQVEKKQEAEQKARILDMQMENTVKDIQTLKESEQKIRIIKHDMRHFMTTVLGYINNDETEKAKEYIGGVLEYIDSSNKQKYCNNEIVNIIISSYESQIQKENIEFEYNIQIPDKLEISDISLTSILSNTLENAIKAVSKKQDNKKIILDMRMNDTKLLYELKNTYDIEPLIIDGIPRSNKHGHGYGTQSIRYVTEKLNGNYQFFIKDNYFIVRIIL